MKKLLFVLLASLILLFGSSCAKPMHKRNEMILNEEYPHRSGLFLGDYYGKERFIIQTDHKGKGNQKDIVLFTRTAEGVNNSVLASFSNDICKELITSNRDAHYVHEERIYLGFSNENGKYLIHFELNTFWGAATRYSLNNKEPLQYDYYLTSSKRMLYNDYPLSSSSDERKVIKPTDSILFYHKTSDIEYISTSLLSSNGRLILLNENNNISLLVDDFENQQVIPVASTPSFRDGIISVNNQNFLVSILDDNNILSIHNVSTKEKISIDYSDAIDVVLLNGSVYYVLYNNKIVFHNYYNDETTTHFYTKQIIAVNAWGHQRASWDDFAKNAVIFYLEDRNTITCDKIDLS